MPTKVIAVVGPTASGKTSLGVALALLFNGEVVSCDSMQIYKGMDIATAKPTEEEMQGIPHHLIGFVSPEQSYSVAKYVNDASSVIENIVSRGKTPILVGGTGLYITSLLDGITFSAQSADKTFREKLLQVAAILGNELMHERLMKIDSEYAKTLHPNNLYRIIRALEIYELTGKTMSEQLIRSKAEPSQYTSVMIGIGFEDRQKIYDRINCRVDVMIEHGLLEEATEFLTIHNPKTVAQAIGIKELVPYIKGEQSIESCVDKLKMETRRYAKRQLTWFRRDARIHWLYADLLTGEELILKASEIIMEGCR